MISEEKLKRIIDNLEISLDELVSDINSLKKTRNEILDFTSPTSPGFYQGSLIFNKRDNEIGFLIGPVDFYEQENNNNIFNKRKSKTYLVVVKNRGNKVINDNYPSLKFNYRIRYLNGNYIEPLEVEPDRNTTSDLDKFCNEQCIMDCQSSCALWKYKKKR